METSGPGGDTERVRWDTGGLTVLPNCAASSGWNPPPGRATRSPTAQQVSPSSSEWGRLLPTHQDEDQDRRLPLCSLAVLPGGCEGWRRLTGEAGAAKPRGPPSEQQKLPPAGSAGPQVKPAGSCPCFGLRPPSLTAALWPGCPRVPCCWGGGGRRAPPAQPGPVGPSTALLRSRQRPHFRLRHGQPPGGQGRAEGAGLGARQTPRVNLR